MPGWQSGFVAGQVDGAISLRRTDGCLWEIAYGAFAFNEDGSLAII